MDPMMAEMEGAEESSPVVEALNQVRALLDQIETDQGEKRKAPPAPAPAVEVEVKPEGT